MLIKDDALSEDDETFKVTLSAPAGGKLGAQTTTAVKILDNDPLPVVSVGDASVTEPNGGAVNMVFPLQLCAPAGRVVSVGFATESGSALEGLDFVKKVGTVKFAAGATKASLLVSVKGDTLDEDNEAFLVNLKDPVKVALGRGQAQGTILDNDGRPALCQPIALVPYTISSSGSYCLARDLFWPQADGQAISIEADFVRLDLRGYRIDGSAGGSGTGAYGIMADERTGVVIRRGRIQGFQHAVHLRASAPYTSSGLHLLEGLEAEGSTKAGLFVAGRNNTVRRCTVLQTGAPGVEGEGEDAFGIAALGPGIRLLDNDVHGITGFGSGTPRALLVEEATGAVVLGNRLSNDGTGTGLLTRSSQDVLAVRNRLIGFFQGLLFEDPSTGSYRGNFTSGVSQPYTGGNDAGGNQ